MRRILFLGIVLTLGVFQGSRLPFLTDQDQPTNHQRANTNPTTSFSFAITADMRYFTGSDYDTAAYFRGAVESISNLGGSAFMVSPGDIDPPINAKWTITRTLGIAYPWIPVVGNHELPDAGVESSSGANMDWLRSYDYGSVYPGPTGCPNTTYSFDVGQVHFVILNEYCDSLGESVTAGDIPDHLYNWLANDLDSTTQKMVIVIGHEPAYPLPDMDNGRIRHVGDSLDQFPENRDRFWQLLQSYKVAAYICGHTHNYSIVNFEGIWQIDAGHARGLGDIGARSTFIILQVSDRQINYQTYRDDANGGNYALMHQGMLVQLTDIYLPLISTNP